MLIYTHQLQYYYIHIIILYHHGNITGKHTDKCACVTHEMASHGLLLEDLENIVSNPSQTEWRLNSTPSIQFYHDLHNFLRKRRIPIEEMGMIYRSIDPTLCQETTTNKQAYSQILYLISGHENPSVSGSDDDGKEDSASKENQRRHRAMSVL